VQHSVQHGHGHCHDRRPRRLGRSALQTAAVVALIGPILTGCSLASIVGNSSIHKTMPYSFSTNDPNMGCASGLALTPFLMGFSYGYEPGDIPTPLLKASILTKLSAGMCAEAESHEVELRRLRAIHAGQANEAVDANIAEKRLHGLAAARNYEAYQALMAAYGTPGADDEDGNLACPEFDDDYPEALLYTLGLSSGLLAVVHDTQSGRLVSVSMDMPPQILRAAKCVDNDRWWGVPDALQAAVLLSLPQSEVPVDEAWGRLNAAADKGLAVGMTLPAALLAQTLASQGRSAELCALFDRIDALTTPPPADYLLLDVYARQLIRHEANKVWTQASGHRADLNALACPASNEPQAPPTDGDLFGD
jgi:hypothetical protein